MTPLWSNWGGSAAGCTHVHVAGQYTTIVCHIRISILPNVAKIEVILSSLQLLCFDPSEPDKKGDMVFEERGVAFFFLRATFVIKH